MCFIFNAGPIKGLDCLVLTSITLGNKGPLIELLFTAVEGPTKSHDSEYL